MRSESTSEVRPLWIHCEGELDIVPIRAAKLALDLPFRIVPKPMGPHTDARVLAVGSKPRYLVDYAYVHQKTSEEGWKEALRWVLGDHDHPKATTVVDILTSIFGPGVREISKEELAAEEKLQLYLCQQDEEETWDEVTAKWRKPSERSTE